MRTGRVISGTQEELAAARAARKRRLIFIGLLVMLIAILSVGGNRSLIRIYQMSKTRTELHREIGRLKRLNQELAGEVQSFKNGSWQVEAIAREELGLVKPGEVVYQFGLTRQPARTTPRTAPR
ncbi:MAG: FtsB family cell division protein [Candidatus Methylomirabilis sp.]